MAVAMREVEAFVKNVLKNGTPDWVRFPKDYKALADEWHKEARENFLQECRAYKIEDQALLSDAYMGRVHPMYAADFMAKLRNAGVRCFSQDSPLKDGTASLFAVTEFGFDAEPICSIQRPIMWEWTTLRIDPTTDLPSGFRDIGWRSPLVWLVRKRVLSEEQTYKIFGRATGPRGRLWRKAMHEIRNGEVKPNAT